MALPVSVVVVSRGRPEALARCLTGIAQLDHASFEVIVVACPAGVAAVSGRADAERIKLIPFDEANISAARNLGIAAAAGEIVAFIDDDAVPEPLWLRHLVAPFADDGVACAGGYVIGRNGISFQWKARSVDRTGTAHPLEVPGDQPVILRAAEDRVIKTEGTNMAVRRDVLADLGGFDPAFRFYLDETDLNMRLGRAGHATAIVPRAQVHHGFFASNRRSAGRIPRDLHEIGASQMVFLRKYCTAQEIEPAWKVFRTHQKARLLRLMQSGPLGADDVLRLLRGLDRGGRDGKQRELKSPGRISRASEGLRVHGGRPAALRQILAGRPSEASRLMDRAREAVEAGNIATVFLFSRSALFHHAEFDPRGIWVQRGGQFGRSLRSQPLMRFVGFAHRVEQEARRIAEVRGAHGTGDTDNNFANRDI